LMALVKSSIEIRELICAFAAPGSGRFSRSRTVSVSRNVSTGIFTSVPSGKWVVLKFVDDTPTSDNGCIVNGLPAGWLKCLGFRFCISRSTSRFSVYATASLLFEAIDLSELVHFDGVVVRNGVRGGSNGALVYRRWMGGADQDDFISESILHCRWLQIK
jgi:hypothetical protein